MKRYTGNTMVVSHFHDFYYMEALLAGISVAKSQNPELQFRKAVQLLESDVQEEFARLTKSLALRVYVYLWSAALGEARHADAYCSSWIKGFDSSGRQAVYSKAMNCLPAGQNLDVLLKVYQQNWRSSGYGGKKWLEIVEGMMMYGNVPDAAFIDHAVDLEHNGGCVFNKDAASTTGLNCYGDYGYSTLKSFLDYKFKHDILSDMPKEFIKERAKHHDDFGVPVSRKTYALITRFSNIIRRSLATEYCVPVLETLSDYTVNWGDDTIELAGKGATSTAKTATIKNVVKSNKTANVKIVEGEHGNFWSRNMQSYVGTLQQAILCNCGCGYYKVNDQMYFHESMIQKIDDKQYFTVKRNCNDIASDVWWNNDEMKRYEGKTLEFKKQGSNYSYQGKVYNWIFSPMWLEAPKADAVAEERREQRRRPYAICTSCDERLTEDYAMFSEITSEYYCQSCWNDTFGTCDKCGDEQKLDDMTETPRHWKYFKLCQDCHSEVMSECEDCGKTYGNEDTTNTEDNWTICENCAGEHYCRKCDEYYGDIEYHTRHEHKRRERQERQEQETPAILFQDGDGVLEFHTDYNLPDNKWTKKTMALPILTGRGYKHIETTVYCNPSTPLIVYDKHDTETKLGNRKSGTNWVALVPNGMFLSLKYKAKPQNVMDAIDRIASLTDWGKMTSVTVWQNLPESVREQIKSEWYK